MFQLTNKIWKTRNAYVLVSEINENERLIQELADEFRYLSPNDFAGEKRYVYYKMNYVEPYKEFNELKKLQIAVKTVIVIIYNVVSFVYFKTYLMYCNPTWGETMRAMIDHCQIKPLYSLA